jgi:hypothetical protein
MVMKFDDEVGACIELFDSASDGEHYDDNYEGALDTFVNDTPHCIGRPITDIVILLQGKFAQQGINIKIFRTYQQAGDSNCGLWVIDNLQQRAYADPLRGNTARSDLPDGLEAINIEAVAKEQQARQFSYKKR